MEQVSMRKSVERFSVIDFHDVFGGPPRRLSSSMQRSMQQFTTDETNKWRSSSSGSRDNEMPVFGEVRPDRRRYTDDSFFDDIFKGKMQQHLDSPRSRVSNITHLANFSKEGDLPASGAAAQSKCKITNSATQHSGTPGILPLKSRGAINGQVEITHDVRSYRPSPLSRGIYLDSKATSNLIKSDKKGSQFHFSIYKWAGKRVPSLISLRAGRTSRLKKDIKFERSSSSRSWIASKSFVENLHNLNAFAITDNLGADKDTSKMNYSEKENEVLSEASPVHIVGIQKTNQEPNPFIFETEHMDSTLGSGNDIPESHISQNAGPEKGSQSSAEELAAEKSYEEISMGAHKFEVRSLPVLFYYEEYDRGNKNISSKSETKEDERKATKKSFVFNQKKEKQDGEGSTQIKEVVNKPSLQSSYIKKGDDEGIRKVKGKEASSSSKVKIDAGSQISDTSEKEKEVSVKTVTINDKIQIKADEHLKETEHHRSSGKTSDYVPNDNSAGQKDTSASNTASIPGGSKATEVVCEEYLSGNFQVKEVLQGEDEPRKRNNNQDEGTDAKIRKWSNGKEGNIRSLLSILSTLQYVLWPESGWKPVPLVDIIEGNALKKAYQKALLCLHPDKLQQKDASSHQKYIAKKVFDILQEAWDHFSSLNPL